MTWFGVIVLAMLAFAATLAMKVPRGGRETIGTALLLGIAGYGLQGSPGLSGASKAPAQTLSGDPAAMVARRQAISGEGPVSSSNFVMIADALARHGQYGDAATVLLGATEKNPDDAEAWLAMANALVGHAEGALTPAALFAFGNAARSAPDHPGPPFFLGLALATSGRLGEARDTWAKLLAATPPGAPWRADLEARLKQLDGFIAERGLGDGAGAAGM
jgi:cytochrome c-type biogenesis protein CcmH